MTPERPNLLGEQVAHDTAEMLVESIISPKPASADPALFAALTAELGSRRLDALDGYALAKALELRGVLDPTAAHVRILDRAADERVVARDWLVMDWVVTHNVMPNHRIGDRISVAGRNGLIVEMERHKALYRVRFSPMETIGVPYEMASDPVAICA